MPIVDGLGKRFNARWVFRGLSFTTQPGQRLAILGKNGRGKSTLLRTIAGLIPATEGKVTFPEGDPRYVMGYSALEMAVYPQLTADEHLAFAANLRGCPARCSELLEYVGLAYAATTPANQMSTGMKARLKLALALQTTPQVLILDEPGAGLDADGRDLIERIANDQAERGCLIFATNDPNERRLATHELDLDS